MARDDSGTPSKISSHSLTTLRALFIMRLVLWLHFVVTVKAIVSRVVSNGTYHVNDSHKVALANLTHATKLAPAGGHEEVPKAGFVEATSATGDATAAWLGGAVLVFALLVCIIMGVQSLGDKDAVTPRPGPAKGGGVSQSRRSRTSMVPSRPGTLESLSVRENTAGQNTASSLVSARGGLSQSLRSAQSVGQESYIDVPKGIVQTLCPTLVVSEPQGIVLGVPVELAPMPQSLVMDIKDLTNHGRVIARAFVSERDDPGIMLESTDGTPVAFVDTTQALVDISRASRGNRHAILRRASKDGWDGNGTPFAVFFLNKNATGSTLVARSGGAPSRSRPLISAQVDVAGKVMSVVDHEGRSIAVSEGPMRPGSDVGPRDSGGGGTAAPSGMWGGGFGRPTTALRVFQGADAGLVLCAVFAAQKLR